jgi:hypothetical protein
VSQARPYSTVMVIVFLTIFGLLAVAPDSTTIASPTAFTYDAPTVACVDVHAFGAAEASLEVLSVVREESARPSAEGRGTCTTPPSRSVATEAAGRPVYPPNRGFEFDPIETTLKAGSSIDRYGPRSGTFASPEGTPFGQRSLPASAASKPYEAYEVLKPIEGVNMGPARPWFGQPGLGVQYELPAPIQQLLDDGFLGVKK